MSINQDIYAAQARLQLAEQAIRDAIDDPFVPAWVRAALTQLLMRDPVEAEGEAVKLFGWLFERATAARQLRGTVALEN